MQTSPSQPSAPLRATRFGSSAVDVTRAADGTWRIRSTQAPGAFPDRFGEYLTRGAAAHPQRLLIAVREPTGHWRKITWGEARQAVDQIAQWLLDRALPPGRPIAILCDSGIEHALLRLAALHVGIPVAQITPAYSLLATDFSKLSRIIRLLDPALVLVGACADFARAIAATVPETVEVVACEGSLADRTITAFDELRRVQSTEAVTRANQQVRPDTPAQILFTSGSTGAPKGVILTQRALAAMPRLSFDALPVLAERPPVLLSWLPWHHGSGCMIAGLLLAGGGSLYIDDGKPVPGLVERTVRNLREVSPTAYFTVPRGFDSLMPYLRNDPPLRERFFRELSMIYYSGAALPTHLRDAMDEQAVLARGERVAIVSGYAATETGVFSLCANWDDRDASPVGLPVPGVELKLVPNGHQLESRIRGIAVTPGYWRQPELTAAAFDEEGYFRTGDALRFVDPATPQRGLAFDGRLGEDFKLTTGTWVHVGALRERFIDAARPLVLDVVLAGADRDLVAALIVPDLIECRRLCPDLPADAPVADVLASATLRMRLQQILDEFGGVQAGSSTRIDRALLLEQPPNPQAGELTDKGSVNQKVLLANRHPLVETLYANPPPSAVLLRQEISA